MRATNDRCYYTDSARDCFFVTGRPAAANQCANGRPPGWQLRKWLVIALSAVCFMPGCLIAVRAKDLVSLEPTVFNPNGGWSWFGDERAIVDTERGILLVGSLANGAGTGGAEKDGDVEVVMFDLESGISTKHVLHRGLTSFGGGDDHNCPALLKLPNGNYLAAYTGHNNGPFSYYRQFDVEQNAWTAEGTMRWDEQIPGGCDFGATYSNLFLA